MPDDRWQVLLPSRRDARAAAPSTQAGARVSLRSSSRSSAGGHNWPRQLSIPPMPVRAPRVGSDGGFRSKRAQAQRAEEPAWLSCRPGRTPYQLARRSRCSQRHAVKHTWAHQRLGTWIATTPQMGVHSRACLQSFSGWPDLHHYLPPVVQSDPNHCATGGYLEESPGRLSANQLPTPFSEQRTRNGRCF